jgi:SUKH-3 immunity protein
VKREDSSALRFSAQAQKVLLKAGWHPGRADVAGATQSGAGRQAIVAAGEPILREFGGLTFSFNDWRSHSTLKIGPLLSPFHVFRLNGYNVREMARLADAELSARLGATDLMDTTLLSVRLGIACMIIGELDDSQFDDGIEFLVLDADGAVHVQSDDLFRVADSFDTFLNRWIDPKRDAKRFAGADPTRE